jgi:signal transduction histidine kinase
MNVCLPGTECLRLRQLRYVLVLAEARSFRRAARALAVQAGVLSHEIAAMEQGLGLPLFERHLQGVMATAAGAALAEFARRVLCHQAETNREVAAGDATLTVGYLDYGPGQEILRAALAEFQAQFPHVTLQLAPRSLMGQQASLVTEGALGIGFSFGPPLMSPGILTGVLLRETVGSAMLPAHHRLAASDTVSLRELRSTPIHTVRMETAPDIVSATFDGLTRGGWRGRLTPGSSSPSETMAKIASGAGWAPTPSSLQEWTPAGTVVIPLVDGPLVDFAVHVVWRGTNALAAAFVRIVLEIRDMMRSTTGSRPDAPVPDGMGRSGHRALFGPRYAERARIARDLHDTVLQGMLGAQLQLAALHERIPPALEHEREVVRQAVERLARVGDEARETVRRLRPADTAPRDLALALASTAEELSQQSQVDFRVWTKGITRTLAAGVEEAAYRIGVEALANAFRHASASLVSVVIEYRDDQFCVCVSDNGAGIPPGILEGGGRAGHFGLAMMRERAALAGAALRMRSDPNDGTRIELSVPGHAAFVVP